MSLSEVHISKDPLSVKWLEKYSDHIDKIWIKLPKWISSICVSISVFLFGISLRGEWIHAVVHFLHYLGLHNDEKMKNNLPLAWKNITMESLYLKNLFWYWLPSLIIGFGIYFIIGGFLHWYFYVRQRDVPEKWKCQPHKWLSPELEAHEIYIGSISLVVANTVSSIMACYVDNGGPSKMYHKFDEYSWTWFFLQWPVIFLYQDYVTYWMHRIYHTPFLYKHFHKLHHKYVQPTAFSVTAIHPVEIVHIQLTTQLPFLLLVPVNFVPFYCILFYTFYNGIIDHSGIDFKAPWWQPWRPDTIFHDNHHQYFHVNFSFNCYFWDTIHGTYRRTDRIYKEDIFYGHGKPLEQATEKELKEEIEERLLESTEAYRNHNYILTNTILKKEK